MIGDHGGGERRHNAGPESSIPGRDHDAEEKRDEWNIEAEKGIEEQPQFQTGHHGQQGHRISNEDLSPHRLESAGLPIGACEESGPLSGPLVPWVIANRS